MVINTHTLLFKRPEFKSCFPVWPQARSSLSGHSAPIHNENSDSQSSVDLLRKCLHGVSLQKQLVFIICHSHDSPKGLVSPGLIARVRTRAQENPSSIPD